MSDKIVKKVENLPQLTAVKRTDKLIQRVAAYARVSTGKEEQQTSIVAQKEYYTDYIKSHAKRGGGRVSGKPHIAPAEENGVQLLEHLIVEALS
ncbi:MAG: hypothetical protein LKG21_06450 [Ruminococcus sp.]|nr:hypothetical protein [Ruminococcus sp.]